MTSKYFYLLFIFFTLKLFATKIEYYDIEETSFTTKTTQAYQIKAQKKILNYDKLKKINFINKKKLLSQNIYYQNGYILKQNQKISFDKAYFLEGIFHMLNCKTIFQNSKINAKSCKINKNILQLKDLFLQKNHKTYRKVSYKINLNN